MRKALTKIILIDIRMSPGSMRTFYGIINKESVEPIPYIRKKVVAKPK